MSDDEEFAGDAVFCSWEVAGTVLVRGSLARAAGASRARRLPHRPAQGLEASSLASRVRFFAVSPRGELVRGDCQLGARCVE